MYIQVWGEGPLYYMEIKVLGYSLLTYEQCNATHTPLAVSPPFFVLIREPSHTNTASLWIPDYHFKETVIKAKPECQEEAGATRTSVSNHSIALAEI